jgi:hypothetical protein
MVSSKATSVEAYLKELPEERREVIKTVRDAVKKNLPDGYRECMNFGMISYEIPLETYPNTYNKQPLVFAAIAAQKNHYALYLSCVYGSAERKAKLKSEFKKKAGLKLDMGKACIRFKSISGIPLPAIGKMISEITVKKFIAGYEKALASRAACD